MKKKSLSVNAVLNMFRTALSVVFPLITFPYVSKVLAMDNVGRYNFAYSVITYFQLFAALGINTYAIREGAKLRSDYKKISQFASEVFTINVLSTILAYIILGITILILPQFQGYGVVLFILSGVILTTTLGCEWVYSIYEEYLYITIRAILAYVFSLILLFVLVKKPDDLINYAIVTTVSTGGANLLYMYSRTKYCKIKIIWDLKKIHFQNHIRPILMIFGNTVTTNIFVNSGVLVLGLLSTEYHVALYSVSSKVYSVVKNLLAAIIIVSVPRLSNYWGTAKKDLFRKTLNQIFIVLISLVLPAVIGLTALSRDIILLISNANYLPAQTSLIILCFALILSIFNWFFTSCILIPTKNEKKVFRTTTICAVVNISVNCICIPVMQENAAAIATMFAEGIGMVISYQYAKDFFSPNAKRKDIASVIIGSVLIIVICVFCRHNFMNLYIRLGVSIVSSIIAYGGILILMKNSLIVDFLHNVRNGRR
ncbi:flippase [uncultured Merdimonas sp.]|uniref:flippase n=1 Tax=uncultured Merdimonas sp. TaxID=2023269 RepID=UPI0032091302